MVLILNIDTALDTATISLARDGNLLQSAVNERQGDHAAWVQPAIKTLMQNSGYSLRDLNAVGVSVGPGSYTGLRIGLSTAKGLCYALEVPLIAVGSLEIMAFSAIHDLQSPSKDLLFCPMIDARRMEVFTAVYDSGLEEVVKPCAMVLTEHSFEQLLKGHKMLFLGNGSLKFKKLCQNSHAMFKNFVFNPLACGRLTYRNFIGNNFAGLAYTEPLYMKEFFTEKDGPN